MAVRFSVYPFFRPRPIQMYASYRTDTQVCPYNDLIHHDLAELRNISL